MKKTYKIEVDCANCANLVETAIRKLPGVAAASINYMTQKMTIESEAGVDLEALMQTVLKAGRKVEPDFEIEL